MALDHLSNLLLAEAEVLYGPHVAELVDPEVGVAPTLRHRGRGAAHAVLHLGLGLRQRHLLCVCVCE